MSKIEVKILEHVEGCMPEINEKGDWIDLRAAEDIVIKGPTVSLWPFWKPKVKFHKGKISLGIGMKLPRGYEAIIACRSSTPSKFGVMMANSIGIIDNSYSGNDDVWQFSFVGLKDAVIKKGDRIAQFRIQKIQGAKNIDLKKVDSLDRKNRGGFGSTGTR